MMRAARLLGRWPRAAAWVILGAMVAAASPRLLHENGTNPTSTDGCGASGGDRALTALPHLSARIAHRQSITIVALGSSSTEGIGASRPENNYPSRLRADLAERLSGIDVRILNRGVGGESVGAMAARLERDAIALHSDLVIWQVGTNDVLRDEDPAVDAAIIRDGIRRLKSAGIDVILMDPQYAPAVLAHDGYRDMLHAIAAAGFATGVPVFHRFEIMRSWNESGVLPMQAALSDDSLHMSDLGYRCLARVLADDIVAAAR
jgi:lysophospholipase L1-like esterase